MCSFTCCCDGTYAPTQPPTESDQDPPTSAPTPFPDYNCSIPDQWSKEQCDHTVEYGLCENRDFRMMCLVSCDPSCANETASPSPSPTMSPTCAPVAAPPPPPQDACADNAKLIGLTLTYTGDNVIDNEQGTSKSSVDGDAAHLSPVTIVVRSDRGGEDIATFTDVFLGDNISISQVRWSAYTFFYVVATSVSRHPQGHMGMGSPGGGNPPEGTVSTIMMHTSCSVPLSIGDSFGSVRVIGFTNNAGVDASFRDVYSAPPSNDLFCEICSRDNKDRIQVLELRWTSWPSGQSALIAAQGVTQGRPPTTLDGEVAVFDATASIAISGQSANNNDRFPATTTFVVLVSNIDGTEERSLHTSCSVSIYHGQRIEFAMGTLEIVGFRTESGRTEDTCSEPGTGCPPPPPPPPGISCNACESRSGGKSRLVSLSLTYTGDNVIDNEQGTSKSSVDGDAAHLSPVTIVVRSDRGGEDIATFTDVFLGDNISISQVRWSAYTFFYVVATSVSRHPQGHMGMGSPGGGNPPEGTVSTIMMHTSCSVPLSIGDSFGSVRVSGFLNDDGGLLNENNVQCARFRTDALSYAGPFPASCSVCDEESGLGPQSLTFLYTGNRVLNHHQSNAQVHGNALFATSVRVMVYPLNNPTTPLARFEAVQIGDSFTIYLVEPGAMQPGPSEVMISVIAMDDLVNRPFSAAGALDNDLETVETVVLDVSCDEPLGLQQSFGSFRLVSSELRVQPDEPSVRDQVACAVQPVTSPNIVKSEECNACADGAALTEIAFVYTGDHRVMHAQSVVAGAVLSSAVMSNAQFWSPITVSAVQLNADGVVIPTLGVMAMNMRVGDTFQFAVSGNTALLRIAMFTSIDSLPPSRNLTTARLSAMRLGAGVLLATATVQTSCLEPLSIGDAFGAIEVAGFANSAGKAGSSTDTQCSSIEGNATESGCANMLSDAVCAAWAAGGFCENHPPRFTYRRSQCLKACGLCAGSADDEDVLPSESATTCEEIQANLPPQGVVSALPSKWWKVPDRAGPICGTSRSLNGSCLPPFDGFVVAADACRAMDARLCTAAELLYGAAGSTGCMINQDQIWSSTACVNGSVAGIMTVIGNARRGQADPVCQRHDQEHAAVRCCADAAPVDTPQGETPSSDGASQAESPSPGDGNDSGSIAAEAAAIVSGTVLLVGLSMVAVRRRRRLGELNAGTKSSMTSWSDVNTQPELDSLSTIKSPGKLGDHTPSEPASVDTSTTSARSMVRATGRSRLTGIMTTEDSCLASTITSTDDTDDTDDTDGPKTTSVGELSAFENGAQTDAVACRLVRPSASSAYPMMQIAESLGGWSETDGDDDDTGTAARRLDQGTEGSDSPQLDWDQHDILGHVMIARPHNNFNHDDSDGDNTAA